MAVDTTEVTGQDAPHVEAQQPQAEQDAASDPGAQEQRGVGDFIRGLFGRRGAAPADDGASGDGAPEEPAEQEPAAQQPDDGERIRREAQRMVDQEIARREWSRAVKAADAGDVSLLREMAEQGNGRAQRELAERGETYELGEARARELKAQREQETLGGSLAAIAQTFDTATIAPILDVLPAAAKKDAQEAFAKAGGGIDGREALVKTALKAYAASLREASDDDVLARIDTDDVFRKKVMAKVRGLQDYDEPDLIGAVSGSGSEDADSFVRSLFKK